MKKQTKLTETQEKLKKLFKEQVDSTVELILQTRDTPTKDVEPSPLWDKIIKKYQKKGQ